MSGRFQKNRKQKKRILAIWLLLILLITGGIGTAVAKYIQTTTGQTLVKAPEFYFTSDLLSTENPRYVLNSAVNQVTFAIRNTADALRVSQVDIDYDVYVDNGASVQYKPGATDPEELANTLPQDIKTEVKYILGSLKSGVTYTVTVEGDAGYTQTLRATFAVSDKDENVYKHLELSPDGYMILTVWTHNVSGTLSVSFPDALIPDNTNAYMGSVYNRDGGAAGFAADNFEKYSSQTFRFFYHGGTYDADDFSVSVSSDGTTYLAESADMP